MTVKDSKATDQQQPADAAEEAPAPPPDPDDHAAFVGRTFRRKGRDHPDRVAYTVDDVVQLRFDGYTPKDPA